LKEYFDSIIAKGGEGVMLREPQSLYKSGRSNSLRKFKPYFDTEVKVIENNYPHGFNCQQYLMYDLDLLIFNQIGRKKFVCWTDRQL
jgi:ATP-dependent DNA ligase